MITPPSIAVFAYAFAHRKTQDFLVELVAAGHTNICVIAAPWQQLGHADNGVYFPTSLRNAKALDTAGLCRVLHMAYHEMRHDDVDAIGALRDKYGFTLGVISGARILKRAVIDLFSCGVMNIHPGKLPETAGLDLFYYTIRKQVTMGVTVHMIDHRVDAGRELLFEETPLGAEDTPEAVQYNNYQSQIRALRRFLALLSKGPLSSNVIDRPQKNEPMTPEQKHAVMLEFPTWRAAQFRAQQGRLLLRACETGKAEVVVSVLNQLPDLLEYANPQGWNPLIIAAFNQHRDIVRIMLDRGANPNATGRNGTSVLMYAKTALLNQPDARFDLLEMLINAGASVTRYDAHGKTILHYVEQAGDSRLASWLRKQERAQ